MKTNCVAFIISLLGCFIQIAHAQAPSVQWQKSLGGTQEDNGFNVQRTSDGGYIMAGSSSSKDGNVTGNHGLDDVWIVKVNSTGDIQWQKNFGGSDDDAAVNIKQTSDGGYIFTGYTYSVDGDVTGNHGDDDVWVVKLDDKGILLWQKTFGGTGDDDGVSVNQTSDGGYIVTGYSYSDDGNITGHHGTTDSADLWVLKLNRLGTLQWQKTLGGTGDDQGNDGQQTPDGGFIITGFASSNNGDLTINQGGQDLWLLKLGSTGDLLWQKDFGGSYDDAGYNVRQTIDGGYIVGGATYSNDGNITGNHGNYDALIVKFNSAGVAQWQKSLGGSEDDEGLVELAADGGYLVGGYSSSNDGNVTGHHGSANTFDAWVAKLNSTGDILWQKSLGGSNNEYSVSIQETTDGGYILGGFSYSNDGDVSGHHGSTEYGDYLLIKLGGTASTQTLYTFTGNGNWNLATNWSDNKIPAPPFAAGTQIVINPQAGGECILNVPVTISQGATFSVVPGAKITINQNLLITK